MATRRHLFISESVIEGHTTKTNLDLLWERTDKVEQLFDMFFRKTA